MAVSDLTGYTWVGNDNVSIDTGYLDYDINYNSNNSQYTIIKLMNFLDAQITYGDLLVYDSSWVSTGYKTIVITGGTDATNSSLISWLEDNGTLTAPQPAGNTYSLSNSLSNASAEDITFIIQPDEGYALPDTVTVTNGTLVSYNKATGEVVVSGASAEISVECEAVAPSGYTVTITNDTDESGWAPDSSFSEDGAFVTDTSHNYVPYQSVSGNVAVFALEAGNYTVYLSNQQINSTEVTGGVVVNTGFYQEVEFTVSADGTLIIHGEED